MPRKQTPPRPLHSSIRSVEPLERADIRFRPAAPGAYDELNSQARADEHWDNGATEIPGLENIERLDAVTWLLAHGFRPWEWAELSPSQQAQVKLAGSPLPGRKGWRRELGRTFDPVIVRKRNAGEDAR